MYCSSCGANNPDDSLFCAVCGARMDVPSQIPQPSYGQSSYNQPPYGQPPYGQPPQGQQPKKGKSKAVWFVIGGAALLLAIALVLIFVVFPGGAKPAGSDEDDLLDEDTMQAEFVNDCGKVFTNALSGLGGVDYARFKEEPFNVDMEYSVEVSGFPMKIEMSAVYDEVKLGMLAEVMGQGAVLLLDDDTLYVSSAEEVMGYRFDTDEDMSDSMTLEKRVGALIKNMSGESGDYMLIIEAMIDSIDEGCFDKSGSETTLKLTSDDMIDMLKTLEEKAEDDEELSDAMKETELKIDDAIDNMEEQDFDLIVTVGYDDDTPVSFEIDFDDGTEYGAFNLQFGAEDTKDGKDIRFKADAAGTNVDGGISVTKDGNDVSYDGELSVTTSGTTETYTLEGTESWDGDEVEGSITVADSYGNAYTIEYSGSVVFGMPEEKVEDDSRFDVDTSDADIQDISDLMSSSGLGDYDVPEVSVTEAAPATAEAPEIDTGAGKLVGITLPTNSLQRWNEDGAYVSAALEELGYEVDLQYADFDTAIQINQIESQIAMGCDVLVIAAIDGGAMGSTLEVAKEAGIPVVAFDRLLMNTDKCDYYVTFSSYDTGTVQGEYIVDMLGLGYSETDTFTLECFAGAYEDANSYLYYQGAMDVLQPYIDSGALVVKSGETDMSDIAIQMWDPALAQERMDSLLTAYYKKAGIDAILSPNDTIAQGIVAALKENGYGTSKKPYPILTGQDCDMINIGMISRGEQSMTVFRDTRMLADQIVTTVDAVLSGKAAPVNTEYDNGVINVPSFNCQITIVDANNWREVLIDSGYYDISDIPTE